MTLSGVDDLGNVVSMTVVTDNLGFYSFNMLRPGVYSITESQPMGYDDGTESAGSHQSRRLPAAS